MKTQLLILTLFALVSCTKAIVQEPTLNEPVARGYLEEFDKVWLAVQRAMSKYAIKINNIDSGILETDYIKADRFFSDPSEPRNTSTGLRYKIIVRAVRGKLDGKPAVKVTVLKTTEIQRDFFSGYQSTPTNGLEETALLYRISRHIEMEKLLTLNQK